MKRRLMAMFLCLVLLVPLVTVTASADCTPKPTTKIIFHDNSGRPCIVTLLAGSRGNGPYSAVTDTDEYNGESELEAEAWNAFAAYEDPDGFCFWGYLEWAGVNWTYYPPETFKVAVYYPDDDVLLVSQEIYERYAFHSDFRLYLDDYDQSGVVSMEMRNEMDWMEEVFGFLCRVVLTLLVELVVAFAFGYRGKQQIRTIFLVNLVTQVVLNVLLSLWYIFDGPFDAMLRIILAEIVVLVVEGIQYTRKLPGGKSRAVWYTVLANLASVSLGWVLMD